MTTNDRAVIVALLLFLCALLLSCGILVFSDGIRGASAATEARITVTCRDAIIDSDHPSRALIEYVRPDRINTNSLQIIPTGRTRLTHNAAIGTTLRVSVFPQSAGLAQARETVQVPRCRWWYPFVGGG